jgi:hypothetical protein
MLQAMQQPEPAHASHANSPSFAGLLAALAAPVPKPEVSGDGSPLQGWRSASAWNDDDWADDVATLSYERALRTHARYHSGGPTDQSLTEPADAGPIHLPTRIPDRIQEPFAAGSPATSHTAPRPSANKQPENAHFPLARELKCSSITIRLSQAECAQLRTRAAEAGLTVSAYLRSCTFEAESLRALVRDTMAQLRSATTAARPTAPVPPRISRFGKLRGWLASLLFPWHRNQSTVRA